MELGLPLALGLIGSEVCTIIGGCRGAEGENGKNAING